MGDENPGAGEVVVDPNQPLEPATEPAPEPDPAPEPGEPEPGEPEPEPDDGE